MKRQEYSQGEHNFVHYTTCVVCVIFVLQHEYLTTPEEIKHMLQCVWGVQENLS